jgi:anti-anti-sigma regulatory factor
MDQAIFVARIDHEGGDAVLALRGDLDSSTVTALQAAAEQIGPCDRLVVDASELAYLSATGAMALERIRRGLGVDAVVRGSRGLHHLLLASVRVPVAQDLPLGA